MEFAAAWLFCVKRRWSSLACLPNCTGYESKCEGLKGEASEKERDKGRRHGCVGPGLGRVAARGFNDGEGRA